MPLNADDALVPPQMPNPNYEFDATAADIPDPAPSEDAPGTDQESPVEPGGQESTETPENEAAPPEFDPRYKQPFLGLLYVGHLEASFTLWGHKFKIATPSRRERMQMGLAVRDYQGTAAFEIAWQAAFVAGYLLEVDGEPLPEPVLNKAKDTAFQERFDWVLDNVREPVMDEIYTKCLELDGTVNEVVEAMGKASG